MLLSKLPQRNNWGSGIQQIIQSASGITGLCRVLSANLHDGAGARVTHRLQPELQAHAWLAA